MQAKAMGLIVLLSSEIRGSACHRSPRAVGFIRNCRDSFLNQLMPPQFPLRKPITELGFQRQYPLATTIAGSDITGGVPLGNVLS